MSGATLAYIGDAVFELMVRQHFLESGSMNPENLHKLTTSVVNAAAQSDMARGLMSELSDEELAVYRRGRNAYAATSPKNMSMSDYHRATGLEALFGYLYLKKDFDRMRELFYKGLARVGMRA